MEIDRITDRTNQRKDSEPSLPSIGPTPSPERGPGPPNPGEAPIYPESLRNLFRNRENLEWEVQSSFHGGSSGRRKSFQLAMWSLTASVIDGLLLFAMNCIFMMVFIKIIRTPITSSVLFDFALIFVFGAWMYMITTRFFIGCSIGEAACDLRLGKPQERLSKLYFLKVLVRASLVTCTGLLLFPLLSLLTGKDLAGMISGLRLFSLK